MYFSLLALVHLIASISICQISVWPSAAAQEAAKQHHRQRKATKKVRQYRLHTPQSQPYSTK
jgi:hypothetical protein